MIDERNSNAETIQDSMYFSSPTDALERYSHCGICGGNLHFTHLTDFVRNVTQEIARCPECGVKLRQVAHRLQ